MNIFWLDNDLQLAARYHNDKHCVKMIVEMNQVLSAAHHVLDGEESPIIDKIYRRTHVNHPCSVWVRESCWNYTMVYDLALRLCDEYTYRYGKVHKCQTDVMLALARLPNNIPMIEATSKPVCMPDECKIYVGDVVDVVASYRNYYNTQKQHLAAWKNRNVPEWYTGELK